MARAEISFLDPFDPRWSAWVIKQPEATIFHHPEWVELLKTCYGFQPKMAAILDTNGQLLAALPLMQINNWVTGRRVVALPFSDFTQPLSVDEVSLSNLVDGLQSWRRQNQVREIRVHWSIPGKEGVYPAEIYARHITSLNFDIQQVLNRFAKTHVQQPIRKAEREGVSILMSDRLEDIRLFYGLHLETRRRLGTPIQPLRFFRLVWERLISRGLGFVLLAYKDSQLLAGAVFFHFNKTLTYKYSASDPAFWNLRPNNLLLWHAIRWGCENGFNIFDWGRTDLDNEGLREFKRGWGSEEQILHYSVLADRPPKTSVNGKAYQLLIPLIQRSPTWVCRAIGEVFYRHFG